ncbi:hypothetical protein HQ393_13370 [Chitinibacter bivalviorum]|uniref:Uncharacterized protein n=1 Tax=Chitinibacter bivalviorum TaxID=2739434 RepID=A0A7H9BL80_9NEIS|nr:hypothetical protein [Chitinibacter bivalviorum]QLG89152.1 hypothetical protein HQ393_13370 [Chitinibacter bivalviorum]
MEKEYQQLILDFGKDFSENQEQELIKNFKTVDKNELKKPTNVIFLFEKISEQKRINNRKEIEEISRLAIEIIDKYN